MGDIQINRIAGFIFDRFRVECYRCNTIDESSAEQWDAAAVAFFERNWRVMHMDGTHVVLCKNCHHFAKEI